MPRTSRGTGGISGSTCRWRAPKGPLTAPDYFLFTLLHFLPQFKVKKGDADEVALRRASKLSSDRDLVEEFIACGVWLLVHGLEVGEVKLRPMPFLKDQMVLSPTFAIEL